MNAVTLLPARAAPEPVPEPAPGPAAAPTAANPHPDFQAALAAALKEQALLNAPAVVRAPSPLKAASSASGDAILGGLEKLRGYFNGQIALLATDQGAGGAISSEQLFETQKRFYQFSILMDLSSKLAGKATQAFDSLLKGQ